MLFCVAYVLNNGLIINSYFEKNYDTGLKFSMSYCSNTRYKVKCVGVDLISIQVTIYSVS